MAPDLMSESVLAAPRGLDAEQIRFHPTSFCDHRGRLFFFNGGLYRGLKGEGVRVWQQLADQGVAARLMERRLLVETNSTNLQLDGFDFIVRHRRLPFVSCPHEWCFQMYRDAALASADIELELAGDGFTLIDCSPWNMLFDGTNPLLVDLGCIVPTAEHWDSLWEGQDIYTRTFLYPLRLLSGGQGRILRRVLYDYGDGGIGHSEFQALGGRQQDTPKGLRPRLGQWLISMRRKARNIPGGRAIARLAKATGAYHPEHVTQSRVALVRHVREEVAAMPAPQSPDEQPAPDQGADAVGAPVEPCEAWSSRQHTVHQILQRLNPASVLHISHGDGWYARLAASRGCPTVLVDADETYVQRVYAVARQEQSALLPLVMDIRCPSPGYGLGGWEMLPARERLRCELVMALAVIPRLVFQTPLTLERIARGLADFSARWTLVQFVPPERGMPPDRAASVGWRNYYSWYTLPNLQAALQQHFREVKPCAGELPGDVLLLCEH